MNTAVVAPRRIGDRTHRASRQQRARVPAGEPPLLDHQRLAGDRASDTTSSAAGPAAGSGTWSRFRRRTAAIRPSAFLRTALDAL